MDGHRRRRPPESGRTFFTVIHPVANIGSLNEAAGALSLNQHVASPRLKQRCTDQMSLGWSHQLDSATVLDVDNNCASDYV